MTDRSLLIVEDDTTLRETLHDFFVGEGYEVQTAPDGHAAMRLIHERPPSAVITDLLMPEKDGLEVLQAVRRRKEHIPLIAITAPTNLLFLDVATRLGADRAFEKPLDFEQVNDALRGLLG